MKASKRFLYGAMSLFSALALAWLVAPLAGCGDDEDNDDQHENDNDDQHENGEVARLMIVGQAGLEAQLDGTGQVPSEVAVGTPVVVAVALLDGSDRPISGEDIAAAYMEVEWKISDPTVASLTTIADSGVNGAALVTGLRAGKVTVTATYRNLSASVDITIK